MSRGEGRGHVEGGRSIKLSNAFGFNTREGKGEAPGKPPVFFLAIESFFMGVFHLGRLASYVIPPQVLTFCFNGLGDLLYYALPGMGRRLEEKIAEAMPEIAGTTRVKEISRRACGSLMYPMLDLIIFARHGERFMRELRIEGMEHLEEADAAGRGVILVGGHLGLNALRIGIMAQLGKFYTPIFLYPGDSPVSRYYQAMMDFGQSFGHDPEEPVFWTGHDTVRRVREHLSRGKRVGIDFDMPGKSVVYFFGRPAGLADGIARFALDTGAAIVPFLLHRGKGVFDNRLVFYEPVDTASTGEPADDANAITQRVARAGEKMVREVPEQWESWFTIRQLWEGALLRQQGY